LVRLGVDPSDSPRRDLWVPRSPQRYSTPRIEVVRATAVGAGMQAVDDADLVAGGEQLVDDERPDEPAPPVTRITMGSAPTSAADREHDLHRRAIGSDDDRVRCDGGRSTHIANGNQIRSTPLSTFR